MKLQATGDSGQNLRFLHHAREGECEGHSNHQGAGAGWLPVPARAPFHSGPLAEERWLQVELKLGKRRTIQKRKAKALIKHAGIVIEVLARQLVRK